MIIDTKGPGSFRLRALACLGLWLVVSLGALLAPGCYGRNCEGGVESFGEEITEGHMVTADVWESSGQHDKWLWFPRQHAFFFDVPALGGRIPYETTAYLSAEEEPNKNGTFAQAGGNVAIFSGVGPNRVDVRNDTCSDYYLRLVVKVPPLPPAVADSGSAPRSPVTDGGALPPDDDAGAPDRR